MISIIPEDIMVSLQENRNDLKVKGFQPASGGCINNGGKLFTSQGHYFLKWNSASRYPGMFEAEEKGLLLLNNAKSLRIPTVEICGLGQTHSYLMMEFIEGATRKKDFFEKMGRQLATLHRTSESKYGLDHHNYIGSLPQYNDQMSFWPEFFITQRLEPQIKMAKDSGSLNSEGIRLFDKLFPKLESYFPEEKPSLLHGDLWSGNFMVDDKGEPCFFDPAVYFGHREMDIAMTRLFGGFDGSFYSAYHTEFPHENGLEERIDLYNLYPLMVHVNLFGVSYWLQVQSTLRRYI